MRIKKVKVVNYKNFRDISFKPKSINIFIGKPNSGKSNLLEALSLLGISNFMEEYIKSLARFKGFYDFLHYGKGNSADVIVDLGDFEVYLKIWRHGRITMTDKNINDLKDLDKVKVFLDNYGDPLKLPPFSPFPIRKYTYDENKFASGGFSDLDYLDYPYGRNVGEILQKNPDILLSIGEIFENFGLSLVVDLTTGNVEIHKYMGKGSVFKFDLNLVSDTLKRMIFYITALKSNRDSVIILEEPEIHTFPQYIYRLSAEIVKSSRENNNQFFISTHNPYMFNGLLKWGEPDELGIFKLEGNDRGEGEIYELTEDDLVDIVEEGLDVFLNVEKWERGT